MFPFLVFLVALAAYLPLQDAVQDVLSHVALHAQRSHGHHQDHMTGLVNQQRPRLFELRRTRPHDLGRFAQGQSFISALNIAYGVGTNGRGSKSRGIAVGMTSSQLAPGVRRVRACYSRRESWLVHCPAPACRELLLNPVVMAALAAQRADIIIGTVSVNYYVLPDVKQRGSSSSRAVGTVLWLVRRDSPCTPAARSGTTKSHHTARSAA